jgi:DNA-binding response OmpR family regulator
MAQSKTILVVDDDDDLRSALAEQIALEEEFQVIEAATGLAGVEAAKASAPDLILLDVDLPDINGCRRRGDHPGA